ncbi:ABC transporter substrate-binding protein [Bacillus shivajii]|uniref:ABC transporter substrate-binding protein n=1 Tax=Bacillus shivajii TaxID=1983719 RepID=UPI001CFADEAD|nr:ABC transporter substrate-binding protein [Bacillus shivajii]UCZ53136.1 ABC transporter substrate-binding protein [Bacillus shivajii]
MNFLKNNMISKYSITFLALLLLVSLAACNGANGNGDGDKPEIVLAEGDWGSFRFHNAVAQLIIEEGYGYPTDVLMGSTPNNLVGIRGGDSDVMMEVWVENIQEEYDDMINSGDVIELAINFDDNAQGFYVPRFVIEGDPERDIEPLAPGLERVDQLHEYWEVFEDPEDPNKGRIHGAIPGWEVDQTMQIKMETYGLNEYYNYFSPGSQTALDSSIIRAYDRGEAWVGYYWDPTWVTGMYDLVLLEEDEYDEEQFNEDYSTAFPSNTVTVIVNEGMEEKAPEIVEFLSNYETSSDLTSEGLSYMEENDADQHEAARWFLEEHQDLWIDWVPEDVAERVLDALK